MFLSKHPQICKERGESKSKERGESKSKESHITPILLLTKYLCFTCCTLKEKKLD